MPDIHIKFFLNNRLVDTTVPFNTTALEFIRNRAGLTGTKLGCGEGDCGTCTIALGKPVNGDIRYKAVNSCLIPVAKLHHKHVVTIEGISEGNQLHPIQTAILEEHATQCGFCTPGITMSLFAYLAGNKNPDDKGVRLALEGNLCRCTGYLPIKKASERSVEYFASRSFAFPSYFKDVQARLNQLIKENQPVDENKHYFIPKTEKELLDYLDKNPDSVKIAGGTDLMVIRNLRDTVYPKMADISEIDELQYVRFDNETLYIGANATLSDVLENDEIGKRFRVLTEALELMASKQIRNIATVSGNIANASPIADTATVLLASEAKIHLASARNRRTIPLNDFYISYKKTELKPEEIIENIEIPLPEGYLYSFEKSSKRKAVDISTVNSAVAVLVKNNVIEDIRIAYGGIAPVPIRIKEAERFLKGKALKEDVILKAASTAMENVKPITDMRGSEEYRKLLVKNHLIKHFHKLFPEII